MQFAPANDHFKELPFGLEILVIKDGIRSGNSARIIAVGDISFSGRIKRSIDARKNYDILFNEVLPLLQTGDLVFTNLETPLVNDSGDKNFVSDPVVASTLKNLGFNIINLANNHILDVGEDGLQNTLHVLLANGLQPIGAGCTKDEAKALHFSRVNGLSIGWLACGRTHVNQEYDHAGYWEYDEHEVLESIQISRDQVDFLILSIHAGLMYLDYPSPELKENIKHFFQAGANLVLIHHAHVLQGVEMDSRGNICCYNLGNFLFDITEGIVEIPLMQDEQTESAIFVFDIDRSGIQSAFAIPVFFDQDFFIHYAVDDRGKRILGRLSRISEDIKCDYASQFETQRAQRNAAPILSVLKHHLREHDYAYVFGLLKFIRLEHLKMFFRYFMNFRK